MKLSLMSPVLFPLTVPTNINHSMGSCATFQLSKIWNVDCTPLLQGFQWGRSNPSSFFYFHMYMHITCLTTLCHSFEMTKTYIFSFEDNFPWCKRGGRSMDDLLTLLPLRCMFHLSIFLNIFLLQLRECTFCNLGFLAKMHLPFLRESNKLMEISIV